MLKLLLIGAIAVFLWYILAPLFTPAPLRGPRKSPRRKKGYDESKVIDGKGKVIR
jgi:hypothetical protein